MTDALARLSGGGIYKPARTREEIDKQLSRFFRYKLSEEAYEFYQWTGAPNGRRSHATWKDRYSKKSTYKCILKKLLGTTYDMVHFLSIEEANEKYADSSIYFPFIKYGEESGILAIIGLEAQQNLSSPVVRLTEEGERMWFPSLTHMMLAIVEAKETIGTLHPQINYSDEDYGTEEYEEKISNAWQTLEEIARKYGSPYGSIILP